MYCCVKVLKDGQICIQQEFGLERKTDKEKLKEKFQKKYPNYEVEVETNG